MPTMLSSVAITAASKTRPGQRSSDRKYGMASRQMVDSDETKPVTGISDGYRSGWVEALPQAIRPLALWFNRSAPLALRSDISPGLVGLRPGSVVPLGIPLDDDTIDVQDARHYRLFENLGT